MKKNRLLPILLLSVHLSVFQGCTDWLNITPREQLSEEAAFSTEQMVNSMLNGIYRDLSWEALYGQFLTQTFTEYLARYYFHAIGGHVFAPFNSWGLVAAFAYEDDAVRYRIQPIWNNAFQLIMRLNVFIENVERLEASVMRESRRNVILGEAYALRAFLHFDIYRLFGPVNMSDAHEGLPYNNSAEVRVHERIPVSDFIDLVLKDLETALRLLESDPIRTTGVNDNHREIILNAALSPEDIFAEYYRNRRMNYFAVRALQARVLLHIGRHTEAENAAQATLNAIRERNTFRWVSVAEARQLENWIFHKEVLFGLNNIHLHTNWISLFTGRAAGSAHVVTRNMLLGNLFPEFTAATVADVVTDVRADQWRRIEIVGESAFLVPESYVSTRFRRPDHEPIVRDAFFHDLQPLIRMSELYLIIVEAALHRGGGGVETAATTLNTLLTHRGYPVELLLGFGGATVTEEEVWARLERNIYLEFVGEGQAFFFLKRNNKEMIFDGVQSGHVPMWRFRYVLPLPRSETDIQ